MTTKLYFHSANTTVGGTLPTTEQSSLTSAKDVDAQTVNRSMSTDKGTSQTTLVLSSLANTSANSYYFTKFVSDPLVTITSITAQTWNYAFAAAENNANANFPVSGANAATKINVYVWRPSTGAKIGTILDGNTAATISEPGSTNTETSEFATFSGSLVSSVQDGDVIICEIWFATTQGNTTARTDTFYYDGTTETNNTGTTVSDHASYIETPQTLKFPAVKALTETVTITESPSLHIVPSVHQDNISGKKGTITLDSTSGAHDQSFTGIGFQPKALIIWGTGSTTEAFSEGIVHSFGMSDGTTDGAVGGGQVDASSTNAHMIRNDAIIEQVSPTVPSTVVVRASVKTLDSDGFTLTYASKTDTTQYVYHYVAIGGSDIANVKVKHETAGTTSTGNKAYTGAGFQPDAMIFVNAFPADTVNTNATGLSLNVGFGAAGVTQFSVAQGRDTSTGTECQLNDNRVLFGQTSPFQNVKLNSALVSLDSDGYTLNHTVAPTTGLPWFYLAIEGGYWACAVFTQKTSTGTLATPFRYDTLPVILFLGAINSATANSNQANTDSTSLGAADAALNEGCTAIGNDGGGGGAFPVKVSLTSAVTRSFTPAATATSSTINAEADINDMSTSGQFTLDWTTANATARKLGYLILTKTVSTGSNITKAMPTETVTISESITRLDAKIRALATQTVSISETPARLATKIRALAAQTVTISESIVKSRGRPRAPSTETVAVSETLARLAAKTRALATQTVSTSESIARLAAKTRALATQTTSTSETLARMKASTRTISETVAISESLARLAAKIRALATQTVSTSETLARLAAKTRALATQTVSISEAVARVKGIVRALSTETTSLSDSLARLAAKTRALPETVSASETLDRLSAKIRALVTETVSISDAVAQDVSRGANHITKTITETVDISEDLARQLAKIRAISETVSTSESLARLKAVHRTLSTETVSVSDAIAIARGIVKALTETVPSSESIARQLAKIRTISESVTSSESATRIIGKIRALATQTVTISDSVAQTVSSASNIVRALTENVAITENLARLTQKFRTLSADTSTISEAVVKSKGVTRTVPTQTTSISDSITRRLAKIRSFLEIANLTEHLDAFKNGILLVAPQRPDKGGYTTPYKKPVLHRLKQILYPVYHVTEYERLERRKKLREYPPLVIIPAFSQSINTVIAPFVVTDPIRNTVYVKFAVSEKSTVASKPVVFTGKAIPIIVTPKQQKLAINKARCASFVMNSDAVQTYGRKVGKLAKVMTLWSIFSSLHES